MGNINNNEIDVERLKEEIADLQLRLEQMNDKLGKSEGYKSHFLSLVTNEIINPFTSILGLSKGITRLKDDEMEKARKLAKIIYSETFFLDFQLNNIFMAARLEAGEAVANPVKVDILTLINNVIVDFEVDITKKQLSVKVDHNNSDKLTHFVSDPAILKTVVANLLSNAIKASNINGQIIISVEEADAMLHISVQDFGVGIDADKEHELFDRFKKLDDTINSINTGTGIGLAVVQGVLDLLHGSLEMESEVGKGSLFKATIPEAIRTECGFATDDGELFFDMDDDSESF
ncbi:MAG: sensor histidine kinase [Bacteroidetes bacterium]|nr:MAG: sensor histidine kinase [Bacteroidota bacterium]